MQAVQGVVAGLSVPSLGARWEKRFKSATSHGRDKLDTFDWHGSQCLDAMIGRSQTIMHRENIVSQIGLIHYIELLCRNPASTQGEVVWRSYELYRVSNKSPWRHLYLFHMCLNGKCRDPACV